MINECIIENNNHRCKLGIKPLKIMNWMQKGAEEMLWKSIDEDAKANYWDNQIKDEWLRLNWEDVGGGKLYNLWVMNLKTNFLNRLVRSIIDM